jgi:hypothetical protein
MFRKENGGVNCVVGVVVQFGLRFAPGACEVRGSNPRDPTKITPRTGEMFGRVYFGFLNSCTPSI